MREQQPLRNPSAAGVARATAAPGGELALTDDVIASATAHQRPTEEEVWARLDAVPGFTDAMAKGIADLDADRGTTFTADEIQQRVQRDLDLGRDAINEGEADIVAGRIVRFEGEPTVDPTPTQK